MAERVQLQETQDTRAVQLHDAAAVEITTLGGLDIKFRGRSLLTPYGGLRKILELLEYLITFRDRRLLPETIIDDLWPGSDFTDPKSVLRTRIFRLRNLIEKMHVGTNCMEKPWLEIGYANGYYTVEVGDMCYLDADVFEETVACAGSLEQENVLAAIGLYRRALDLYGGPYMVGRTHGDWLFPFQNRYHRVYTQALSRLLRLLSANGAHQEIVDVCEKAILVEPYDEALHLYFLQALVELGDVKGALSHYTYVTSFLYRELGVKPSASLRSFYRKLTGTMQDNQETDLTLIRKKLADEDDMEGAFLCDVDHFRFLCQVEIRRSLRTEQANVLGLITVFVSSQSLSASETQAVSEEITEILRSSLRKGDVFAWWNDNQILLLLALQDKQNLDPVAHRLRGRLQDITNQGKVRIRMEFQPLSQERSFVI